MVIQAVERLQHFVQSQFKVGVSNSETNLIFVRASFNFSGRDFLRSVNIVSILVVTCATLITGFH